MKRKSNILKPIAVIFFVSLFSLCFTIHPNNVNAEKVLKIGGVFELSGTASTMGFPESEGLKLAVSEINDKGGVTIDGETYKIKLFLFDTRANPSDAVGIVEKLITREGVKAIFSGAYSATNLAMHEITQPANVLHLCVGCTAFLKVLGKPGKDCLFKASPFVGGEKGTEAHFIPFVVKKNNIKTAIIMLPSTDAGKMYAEIEKKYIEEAGGKLIDIVFYNPKLRDFYPQLSKIKMKNPDMFGIGFTDYGVIPILRQSVEMGIKSKLVGLGAGMSEKAAYATGEDKPIEGYTWIAYTPPLDDPKVLDFCKRYEKFYNKPCKSDVGFSILMYETLHNVLWAMQKVGSTTDTLNIAKTLRGHRFDEGIFVREYSEIGLASSDYWAAEVKNGKILWETVPLKK